MQQTEGPVLLGRGIVDNLWGRTTISRARLTA